MAHTEPAARLDAPAVRVVVVTLSPGEQLAGLLDSLAAACSMPYEVVVADNGSDDGSIEAAGLRPEVTVIRTGGNIGYGKAANLAARGSAADHLLICNPDLVLSRGSLDTLLAASAGYPRAGALGPLIREPSGEAYPSARSLPALGKGIGHGVFGRVWPGNPWTAAYLADGEVRERPAGWLSGACLLVKRAAWLQVGGFDPGYFMYFEDVDLGDRLGRAGWSCVYVPSAEVVHVGGTTTARAPVEMQRAHHASAARYIAGREPKPVAAVVRAGLALRLRAMARRK